MTDPNLDQMIANIDRLKADMRITPKHTATPPCQGQPFPYFNNDIQENINDIGEERLLASILDMSWDELVSLKDDINTDNALNPNYRHSRDCIIKCKGILRRANTLKKSGLDQPSLSIGEALGAWMGGWLIADEFWKRHD